MDAAVYWTPFAFFALLSFAAKPQNKTWLYASAVFLILLVGLRHEVGADWGAYLRKVDQAREHGLLFVLQRTDWGYAFVTWLGGLTPAGIYLVNLVCAVLAIVPLIAFCGTRKNPALALMIAMPYLVTVVYMGYTRQGVAVGLGMLALLAIERQRIVWFLAAVTLAALFHKAAVCLFVLSPALFAGGRLDRISLAQAGGIVAYGLALTWLLFTGEAASLSEDYVVATGDPVRIPSLSPVSEPAAKGFYSQGALLRIAQSVVAVAAFAFIVWRTRLKPAELWLWSIVSACILFLFALAFFRSTLADRVALFFMPLQIYAFATLPGLFARPFSIMLQVAIIACFAASFWVWQNFGSDSTSWIPYQSILTQWVGL